MAKPSKKGGNKWDDDDDDNAAKGKKKGKAEKKATLTYAEVRRIMKSVGGLIVEEDAVNYMIDHVVDHIKALTADALKIVRKNDRKKLTRDDVELVVGIKK